MSLIETRGRQMFPVLGAEQIGTFRRFASGPARRFRPNEPFFDVGDHHAPVWMILDGAIDVVRRDGLGRVNPITVHGSGQFTGEISQLAGRGSLAAGKAGAEGCLAIPLDAAHLRALIIGSADLGEIVMRADPAPRGGDGAAVVAQVHGYLADDARPHKNGRHRFAGSDSPGTLELPVPKTPTD